MGLFGGGGGLGSIFSSSSPIGGAALSGLGGALFGPVGGAAVGNYLGSAAQERANKQNHDMALEMFNLNKKETDTAHQRQVKDLRAAGLNPVLAAGGSGASSASGSASKNESTMKNMANLGATAQQAAQNKASIENTSQDTQNKQSVEKLTNLQQQTEAVKAQQTAASAKAIELENERKKYDLPNAKARSDYEKKQREIDTKMQKFDNVIQRINQTGNAIGSAVSSVIPRLRINMNTSRPNPDGGTYDKTQHYKVDRQTGELLD